MTPDYSLARVHRLLGKKATPQAVVRDRRGRLELIDARSARFQSIVASESWAKRVLGVFEPTVSLPAFLREVVA